MPPKMQAGLKDNFKSHMLFANLMEEINQIHLNHEKKFLLFDKNNTMKMPEPMPEVEDFEHLKAKTYDRFPSFDRNYDDLSLMHISKRPKELRCEKQILQKGS